MTRTSSLSPFAFMIKHTVILPLPHTVCTKHGRLETRKPPILVTSIIHVSHQQRGNGLTSVNGPRGHNRELSVSLIFHPDSKYWARMRNQCWCACDQGPRFGG